MDVEQQPMGERRIPLPYDHEETIAAFDRERAEAHELNRRHYETIARSRRNDRLITEDNDNHDQ
jgi:hypothetical protein